MSSGFFTSPSQPINNIYNTQNSGYNAKNMHTSPKIAPGHTPRPDSHNASSHNATACVFDDAICRKNEVHQAKERNILRQGVLGCYCGCRKRSNDDLHRARQGVVSRARTKRLSKARAMQGRAGQGGTGTPFRKKISLPSSTNEDVVDTGGVVFKKHHCKRLPSHLRQSSTHAHSR